MSARTIQTPRPATPPEQFPDPLTCRVKLAGFGDYMDCCSQWGWRCPFSLSIGDGYLCRHPLKQEILARTQEMGKFFE